MKPLERVLLVLVTTLVILGVAAGVLILLGSATGSGPGVGPGENVQIIDHDQLRQDAAMNPKGAQLSLWRQDLGKSVMLFGAATTTGAFTMNDGQAGSPPTLGLRELLDRAGGFDREAVGEITVLRKVDGAILPVVSITKAEITDQSIADVQLQPGDVVHAR